MNPNGSGPLLVINATCIGSRLDGIGVYALSLAQELSRLAGCRRLVLVFNRRAAEHVRAIALPPHVTVRWAPGAISPEHGLRGHLLRLLYANYLSMRFPGATVFACSPFEAVFFHRRHVVTVHDTIPLQFPQYHRRQYVYFRFVLGSVLRRLPRVIVPSRHTADMVHANYDIEPARIIVIPNGVRAVFRRGEPSTEKRLPMILFTGRSQPTKNVRRIIEAFRSIRDRVDHRLVLAGQVAAGSIPDIAGDDRIESLGYVSDVTLDDLYSRADLFVFPTLAEGFGMPPLEAMARGCPVIASRCGSLPEVCGDAAYYVDEHDSHAIAEGMVRVLTDGALHGDLARRGLARVMGFDWGDSARQILTLLDGVAAGSLRSPGRGH